MSQIQMSERSGQSPLLPGPQRQTSSGATEHSVSINQSSRNVRFIRAKDLDPYGEMFHVMLSYRDATEKDFIRGLYQKLQLAGISQERSAAHMLVPTKWPRDFLRKDPKQCPANFHTFWDKENLPPGKDWMDGFSGAILQCLVFVPILSYYSGPPDPPADAPFQTNGSASAGASSSGPATATAPAPATITVPARIKHSGAIGQFIENRAALERRSDPLVIDNMLLELLLAMEVHKLAIAREKAQSAVPENEKRQRASCIYACMRIFPIFKNDKTIPKAEDLDKLLDFTAYRTNVEAKRILEANHLEPSAELTDIKVKAVYAYMSSLQGAVAKDLGDDLHQQESLSSLIVHGVSQIFEPAKMQVWHEQFISKNRPLCHEMNVWLRQQNLSYLAHHLSNNGITSVMKLSQLVTDDVRLLAGQVGSFTGRTVLLESAIIRGAVEAAKSSKIRKPLNYRLANFVDKKASFLTAIRSQSAVVLIHSKPQWMLVFFIIGSIFLMDGATSAAGSKVANDQITQLNSFSFALLFFASCFGAQVFSPKVGSVLFRLGWVVVFLANSILCFVEFQYNDQFSVYNSLDCKRASTLGLLKGSNKTGDYSYNLCCNFYFYGYYLYFELFSFLIVVFLFVKESYVWRTWLLFGISANVLRAIFYSLIFDQQEATTVYFVGQDHDVAVPAVFSVFLLLLYVFIEVVSRRAKRQAIESHKQALVPSAKTRWTSVMHIDDVGSTAASNQLDDHPHFQKLADLLDQPKYDQVNDFLLDKDNRLKPKPKHMRVPPILQSIQNLDLLYAHAEFINDHFQLWVADWFRKRDSNGSSMTFESSASEPGVARTTSAGVARTTSAGVARTTSAGGTPRTVYVETKSKMFADSSFGDVFDINMEDVAAIAQRGPAKSIERSIEKVQPPPAHVDVLSSTINGFAQVYRSYNGDTRLLTDIVRCKIDFDRPEDLLEFFKKFVEHADLPQPKPTPTFTQRVAANFLELSKATFERHEKKDDDGQSHDSSSVKPLHDSSNGSGCCAFWSAEPPAESQESKKQAKDSKNKAFRLLRVRNRFDHRLKDDVPGHLVGGYRDFAVKIEIGFETSPTGTPWFVPVGHWDSHDARRMVVELQGHVHVKGSGEITEEVHKRYVQMRNALCI